MMRTKSSIIPTYKNRKDEITQDDLEKLIECQVPESKRLDYKASFGSGGGWAKEWCKDISALANTEGGCIIVGMEEEQAIPTKLTGISDDPDKLTQRLEQSANSNIKPRISIDIKSVALSSSAIALVITTPRSRYGPHMNMQDKRIYKRGNAGVEAMDTDELRRAFLFSRSQEEVVLSLHRERVKSLPDKYVDSDHFAVILDFYPVPLDEQRIDPSLRDEEDISRIFYDYFKRKGESRISFDGYVIASPRNYVSGLFECRFQRSGSLLLYYSHHSNDQKIGSIYFVKFLQQIVQGIHSIHAHYGIHAPLYGCMTIHGCQGWTIHDGTFDEEMCKPIDLDRLEFPPIFLDQEPEPDDTTALTKIRPWLHRLWNASDRQRCGLYDADTGKPNLGWLDRQ